MAVTGSGVQQIFRTALTSNETTAQEELGRLRFEYDSTNGEKVYQYIKAGSAIAAGDNVVWTGITGYTASVVTTAATTGLMRVIGVGLGTITSGSYGWIQVRGYNATIKKSATATSSAGKATTHSSGKLAPVPARSASGKASSPLVVQSIVLLSSKACTCTTSPGMIACL
jgi:hypothetical protein